LKGRALGTTSLRVLIVDDFEPFVRLVSSILEQDAGVRIVGHASDGLEAVQKAEQLQPDLILLDIGLPRLDGIEAARRIRKVAPAAKILFVTAESSPEVMQEALRLGAGYVVKSRVGGEILPALEALRRGMRFVSGGFSAHNFPHTIGPQVLESYSFEETELSPATRKVAINRRHEVQFYSDDLSFLVGFTGFVLAALKAGNAVIVVATESHRKSLLMRLREHGVDTASAIQQGRYIALDVADTLSTFMVDDIPDRARFLKVVGDLIATALKAAMGKHPRVAACGECAPVLWAQGKGDAAVQLEHLWDEVARTSNMDILCGYVAGSAQQQHQRDIYERICAEHSAVYSYRTGY
jgi:DNA-binding NarL/FixJ family response regulator